MLCNQFPVCVIDYIITLLSDATQNINTHDSYHPALLEAPTFGSGAPPKIGGVLRELPPKPAGIKLPALAKEGWPQAGVVCSSLPTLHSPGYFHLPSTNLRLA